MLGVVGSVACALCSAHLSLAIFAFFPLMSWFAPPRFARRTCLSVQGSCRLWFDDSLFMGCCELWKCRSTNSIR